MGINQKNSASCIIRAFERVALLENKKLNKLPLSEFQKISEESVFCRAQYSLVVMNVSDLALRGQEVAHRSKKRTTTWAK